MRAWNYAYREARKGDYWQQVARDHDRFRARIRKLEQTLNPILENNLRQRIFKERFDKS